MMTVLVIVGAVWMLVSVIFCAALAFAARKPMPTVNSWKEAMQMARSEATAAAGRVEEQVSIPLFARPAAAHLK